MYVQKCRRKRWLHTTVNDGTKTHIRPTSQLASRRYFPTAVSSKFHIMICVGAHFGVVLLLLSFSFCSPDTCPFLVEPEDVVRSRCDLSFDRLY